MLWPVLWLKGTYAAQESPCNNYPVVGKGGGEHKGDFNFIHLLLIHSVLSIMIILGICLECFRSTLTAWMSNFRTRNYSTVVSYHLELSEFALCEFQLGREGRRERGIYLPFHSKVST